MKNPIVIFNNLLKTKSGRKAMKITNYIVSFSLKIYSIPIILSLIYSMINPIGILFLGIILISIFPFCKYILIPKIDKKFNIYIKNT